MTQLDRMERKLDRMAGELRVMQQKPFTIAEAMQLLAIKSRPTFYRLMREKGIKPIRRGRYARNDVMPLTES